MSWWAYGDEQWHQDTTQAHGSLGTTAAATLPWSDVDSGGDNPVPPIGALVADEEDEPRRRRRVPWLLGIILLVGGASGGALWFLSQDERVTSTTDVASDGGAPEEDRETEGDDATSTDDEDGTEDDAAADEEANDGSDGSEAASGDAGDGTAGEGATGAGDGGGSDSAGSGDAGSDTAGGGGGDTGGAENTPDQAVTQMFEAMQSADCETFPSTISASSRSMMLGDDPGSHAAACRDMLGEPNDDLVLHSVEVVSEDGSSAQVMAEVTEFGETYDQELPVVLEDGAWRVDMMSAF